MNKVHVIGDAMLDVYETVCVERVSQEAPVFVCRENGTDFRAGGAANAAMNCVAIGSPEVRLTAVVGDDEEGARLREICSVSCVDSRLLAISGTSTTVKRRIADVGGTQFLRIDRDGVVPNIEELKTHGDFSEPWEKGRFDSLFLSDYGKGMLTEDRAAHFISRGRRAVQYVVVNGKPKNVRGYKQADCLVFNYEEACKALVQFHETDFSSLKDRNHLDVVEGVAIQLFRRIRSLEYAELKCLVVTAGANGMVSIDHKSPHTGQWSSAPAVKNADVVGAGDTVAATIAVFGAHNKVILDHAAKNAAEVVSKFGTATPAPKTI